MLCQKCFDGNPQVDLCRSWLASDWQLGGVSDPAPSPASRLLQDLCSPHNRLSAHIPVGAGLPAKNSRAPRLIRIGALSLTIFAGKPAPTGPAPDTNLSGAQTLWELACRAAASQRWRFVCIRAVAIAGKPAPTGLPYALQTVPAGIAIRRSNPPHWSQSPAAYWRRFRQGSPAFHRSATPGASRWPKFVRPAPGLAGPAPGSRGTGRRR